MKKFNIVLLMMALSVYNFSLAMYSGQVSHDTSSALVLPGLVSEITPFEPVAQLGLLEVKLQQEFIDAIRRGDEGRVQELIAHGALVNLPSPTGWTPLHAAATQGYEGIVRILLDSGIKELIRNSRGYTPADVAKTSAIRQLIESNHLPIKVSTPFPVIEKRGYREFIPYSHQFEDSFNGGFEFSSKGFGARMMR